MRNKFVQQDRPGGSWGFSLTFEIGDVGTQDRFALISRASVQETWTFTQLGTGLRQLSLTMSMNSKK